MKDEIKVMQGFQRFGESIGVSAESMLRLKKAVEAVDVLEFKQMMDWHRREKRKRMKQFTFGLIITIGCCLLCWWLAGLI